jgi:hypothetical protein
VNILAPIGRTPVVELRRIVADGSGRVLSDAFSREKRDNLVEVPSEDGRTTRALIERMIATAAERCAAPNTFYADQFNNPDAAAGDSALEGELWEQ